MVIFPMLRLSQQDKRIMQAIQACPEGVALENWQPLLEELFAFLVLFLKNEEVAALVRNRRLTVEDLLHVYTGGVAPHMPNPFIHHGGPMVGPSLWFYDAEKVGIFLDGLSAAVDGLTGETRAFAAKTYGAEMAEVLFDLSVTKFGKCELPRIKKEDYEAQQIGRSFLKGCGCGSITGLLVISLFGYLLISLTTGS